MSLETLGIHYGQTEFQERRVIMIRTDKRPARHSDEVGDRVRVTVRRAVMHDDRPPHRRIRQNSFVVVGGAARERDGLTHRPGKSRDRRFDDRHWRRVVDRDGYRLHVEQLLAVRGLKPDGHRRWRVADVGELRCQSRSVVERAVAIQVPRISERLSLPGRSIWLR